MRKVVTQIRKSSSCVYQGKWCIGGSISPIKVAFQQPDFFVFLQRRKELLIPAANAYHATFKNIFSLAGTNLPDNRVIVILFRMVERSCLPVNVNH